MTSPFDAVARLSAIEASQIVLAARSQQIQEMCKKVCKALDGDRAQVNIITTNQQVFIGDWPTPRFWKKPVALQESGCREVVLADRTLAISDTRLHPVMCLMPWVMEWRGYIGSPIHYDGEVIGAMCVLTEKPREWSSKDVARIEEHTEQLRKSL